MQISTTFTTGAIGEIVSLHAAYYQTHWSFGTFFEAKVARELAEFALRKTDQDLALIAHDDNGVAASMILDLNDPSSGDRGAHLRWFIASDRCRGTGIGRDFMTRALAQADQHTDGKIWLTTFAGLAPARHLYDTHGFILTSEEKGNAWGTIVTEQEFRR